MGVSYGLLKTLPSGLVPAEDKGELLVFYQLPPASALSRTASVADGIWEFLGSNPNVKQAMLIPGFDMLASAQRTSGGAAFITLEDWDKRKKAEQGSFALAQSFMGYLNQKFDAFILAPESSCYYGLRTCRRL